MTNFELIGVALMVLFALACIIFASIENYLEAYQKTWRDYDNFMNKMKEMFDNLVAYSFIAAMYALFLGIVLGGSYVLFKELTDG